MTDIRITVLNTSEAGGTFLTPFWFGFHDGSFDVYDRGETASEGLERVAEDGTFDAIAAELTAADADGQGGVIAGAAGPIATGELAATVVDVDGESNGQLGLVAMILPSNDAFVGTGQALEIFDEDGNFLGPRRVDFSGEDVLDAGTEVNTEMDAAFINQTEADAGEEEGGVVESHPGFIGSEGNPDGDPIILGGTNAFGVPIDTEAADFTREGAQVASIRINIAVETEGEDGDDRLVGDGADDLVSAGDGNDFVLGRRGYDDIAGEGGNDKLFGNNGRDIVSGGDGDDFIGGGRGADVLSGDEGADSLRGGRGDDTFLFATGDGDDVILGYDRRGDDRIALEVDGIESFDDVLALAEDVPGGVEIDFGGGDSLFLTGVDVSDLEAADFGFF